MLDYKKNMKDELNHEISRGNFTRTLLIAESMGLQGKEMDEIKEKALWQMSAICRNPSGTKSIAQRLGVNKEEVKEILERLTKEAESKGDTKVLEPCYDYKSGKYLSFEQWLDDLIKRWDKIQV